MLERFSDKIYRGEGACHLWTGSVDKRGYGTFKWNGRARKAHRVAWEFEYGPIPLGLYVLHRCDVPGCVNPSHLFTGTQRDNMADMVRKGRTHEPFHGEKNPSAILTEKEVKAIRAIYRPRYGAVAALARQFGVARTTISSIVNGGTWTHCMRAAPCSA